MTSSGCPWIASFKPLSRDGQWPVHDDLWKAMVFHSENMTSPSELVFQDHGFESGNLGLLQDFDVGAEVAPVDVEDGAQAVPVKALEEADVAAVGDPGLRAVEKSGDNNSAMDTDLCFAFRLLLLHTHVCIECRRSCWPLQVYCLFPCRSWHQKTPLHAHYLINSY